MFFKKISFKAVFILIFSVFIFSFSYSQTKEVYGTVKDKKTNKGLSFVKIFTEDLKYGTVSDSVGNYFINVPDKYDFLFFTFLESEPRKINIPKGENKIKINVFLAVDNLLDNVIIEANKVNATGIITVKAEISEVLPSVSGGIESLIKTELGVAGSRNELSSKYSVRGGSFDENLVYVNGIEIYRPQLIRSGQQEGLSFINPMMVSEAKFSSGGFGAEYGGKMSSVLDIKYKHASENKFSISAGFLGGSVFLQRVSKNKKLSLLGGLRYKITKYLLKSLETSGNYNPRFIDFQSFLSYKITKKLNLKILANISDSKFNFIPSEGTTNFGNIDNLLALSVYYTGQETDRFYSNTGSVSFNFNPNKDLNFSFNVSAYSADESEKFDIIGFYDLNKLNNDIGSSSVGDSILNLGNGAYMQHARNKMIINGIQAKQSGYYKFKSHFFDWGLIYKYDNIKDKTDEWSLIDSASYSVPKNQDILKLDKNIKGNAQIFNNKYTAYIQDKYLMKGYMMQYEAIGGIRFHYNTSAKEFFAEPRVAFAVKLSGKNKHNFRFSSGVYNQPVFYREIKRFDGSIAENKSSQKSIHFVLGHNFIFPALGRNFKLYTEIYYKKLENIIPFEIDNIRIRYYPDTRTSGYVKGIDLKLAGDFVPGIDSWFSLSILKTKEKITDGVSENAFYIPRPTDQRVTANLFVQDYIPGNKKFKAFFNFVFGTGFPFGQPENLYEKGKYRSISYHRADFGASAVLVGKDKKNKSNFLKNFKSIWLTAEVFNMLNIENTVSYRWVHVVSNTNLAVNEVNNFLPVPYKLTGIRFNLKLTVKI